MASNERHTEGTDVDAVVVGAGFSGLYMLHRLRELGLSARVYEKADDVGGTWYWNRYPGARCDSESHIYCYSFSDEILEEWEWSERYPEQPEILEYLRFVADRLDLRRDIQFETEVTSAVFDEDAGAWEVRTDDGERVTAQFFISAVGCLSKPFIPDFDGLDTFEGDWYHTAKWPHDPVDFGGRRVGVIGTGCTGIQVVPKVAEEADHLTVFQRTPNYPVPAGNRPLDPEEYREIKENYDEIWEKARRSAGGTPSDFEYASAEDLSEEEMERALEERWGDGDLRIFGDVLTNEDTNEFVAEFIRSKIREIVDDPETAEKLVPTEHPYGAKRPPLATDYYETYNRDDVSLVDVGDAPIERITPDGIRTTETEYELDAIVFATGFDAMTGTLFQMDIRGRDGLSLEEKWDDGPRTYLGLSVHGFPNMFTITGPQSPSVKANMPVAIEQHVEWISDCIEHMVGEGIRFIEPTKEAEDGWVAHNNDQVEGTVYTDADSWYVGSNIPGKPRTFTPFVGGLGNYRDTCDEVAEKGYEGFELTGSVRELGRPGGRPQLSAMEGD